MPLHTCTHEDCGRGIKGEKSDRSVIFLHIYVHFTWYTLIFFLHMYMYKKKLFYLFDFDISIAIWHRSQEGGKYHGENKANITTIAGIFGTTRYRILHRYYINRWYTTHYKVL